MTVKSKKEPERGHEKTNREKRDKGKVFRCGGKMILLRRPQRGGIVSGKAAGGTVFARVSREFAERK
jgi:hypothetical protein